MLSHDGEGPGRERRDSQNRDDRHCYDYDRIMEVDDSAVPVHRLIAFNLTSVFFIRTALFIDDGLTNAFISLE